MPRTCFVIMPFSDTPACTEEEWTCIFENLFRTAVENAGLDYECRRSTATRGNLVAGIIQDINDAYVVLADLTDRNANVFYELGVRHALKDRTILLAQSRDDIPFDLYAYASHVYDWRTEEGRTTLARTLSTLLREIDDNPDRPDNPVSDFLGRRPGPDEQPAPAEVEPREVADAQPLLCFSASSGLPGTGRNRDGMIRSQAPTL